MTPPDRLAVRVKPVLARPPLELAPQIAPLARVKVPRVGRAVLVRPGAEVADDPLAERRERGRLVWFANKSTSKTSTSGVTAGACGSMARGPSRRICHVVPAAGC
ncbi:hypothetical protein VD0003_g8439 [Verticillium dahliae]|nr:hypothetical protein VD0003_g8439 [Verticillium dahliae]